MRSRMDLVVRAGASALLLALVGCGGSTTPAGPDPTPTPRPTPPPPAAIAQGGFQLPVLNLADIAFTTTSVGTLEAVVDWTFPSNDVDVYITRSCSFEQFIAEQCTMVAFSESASAKPERPSATNVQAGSYTLWIGNIGPTDESVSYQVVFTANAAAGGATGVASVAAPVRPSFAKGQFQGAITIH